MTTTYAESVHSQTGGVHWQIKDKGLAIEDGDYALMDDFVKSHLHDDYMLSIYDSATELTVEIDCPAMEMPQIVSCIYRLEHAIPLSFIGENPLSCSYVVGMRCARGRLSIRGMYTAENGKLIDIEN